MEDVDQCIEPVEQGSRLTAMGVRWIRASSTPGRSRPKPSAHCFRPSRRAAAGGLIAPRTTAACGERRLGSDMAQSG